MKRWLLVTCLMACGVVFADEQMQFKVFLDDKEIGYHTFNLSGDPMSPEVSVEAAFDVKFLFINAYSYRHAAQERWQDGCLVSLNALTEDGGEEVFVKGQSEESSFQVETDEGRTVLQGCVRSFAYWKPQWLQSSRLLNTQTGEYEAVERTDMGVETVSLNEQEVVAQKYRLSLPNEKFIDLWYSLNGDWLSLSSPVNGGRVLRYFRQGAFS